MTVWNVRFRPHEWVVVYSNRRIVVINGDAIQERDGRYRFHMAQISRLETVMGSTSMAGEVTVRSGQPLIQDHPEVMAILDAVAVDDFSWNESEPIEPPGRDEFSVSVFFPPGVDRAAIEAHGILYDDSGDEHLDANNVYFNWFRPLAPQLMPAPDTELGRQLATTATQWGGIETWEILAYGPIGLTDALIRLADHTDLVFITVDQRFYDLDRFRWKYSYEGKAWDAGWSRWITGREDPLSYDYGPDEPLPKIPRVSLPPGPELIGDHPEWAIIYQDGCVVFVHADTVEERDGYYRFDATTTSGPPFNLAWVSTQGVTALLQGTPLLKDNPEAVAALDPLDWGQDPYVRPDTDIGAPPRDNPADIPSSAPSAASSPAPA